jgi:predicted ATPase
LLAAVFGEKDIDARLAAMQTLDLIRQRRIDFMFKHALVRDALYQSLLSEARTALALIVIE